MKHCEKIGSCLSFNFVFFNKDTNCSFSSAVYVFNFWTFEATSIKFNLLYNKLLITSNFTKQLKKARIFLPRLLFSQSINSFFCSNIKMNDLNKGNTDIKKSSLARADISQNNFVMIFFLHSLPLQLISFASFLSE